MTDLFGHTSTPASDRPRRVGHGNAMFLADLAENVPDTTMRAKFRDGDYPDLHQPSINAWRHLRGRS